MEASIYLNDAETALERDVLVVTSKSQCSQRSGRFRSELYGCTWLHMTAMEGARLNVTINLPDVRDEEKREDFSGKGPQIYDEAETMARSLYSEILNQL